MGDCALSRGVPRGGRTRGRTGLRLNQPSRGSVQGGAASDADTLSSSWTPGCVVRVISDDHFDVRTYSFKPWIIRGVRASFVLLAEAKYRWDVAIVRPSSGR
eukprot:scaffold144390_cov34-Prasinocladus_malaysianus.AAC.1